MHSDIGKVSALATVPANSVIRWGNRTSRRNSTMFQTVQRSLLLFIFVSLAVRGLGSENDVAQKPTLISAPIESNKSQESSQVDTLPKQVTGTVETAKASIEKNNVTQSRKANKSSEVGVNSGGDNAPAVANSDQPDTKKSATNLKDGEEAPNDPTASSSTIVTPKTTSEPSENETETDTEPATNTANDITTSTDPTTSEKKPPEVSSSSISSSVSTTSEASTNSLSTTESTTQATVSSTETITISSEGPVTVSSEGPATASSVGTSTESSEETEKPQSSEVTAEKEKEGMSSGIIALVMAIVFAVVVIIVYVGLLLWRRYLEYRYGNRELLVNDLEFDTNDLRHFEL